MPQVDFTEAVVPRPHGPLIQYDEPTLLLMDFIPGDSMRRRLDARRKLIGPLASKLCEAYLALPTIRPTGEELCTRDNRRYKATPSNLITMGA